MGRRIRNLVIAIGMSLAMWALIIQGTLALYQLAYPGTDPVHTASTK